MNHETDGFEVDDWQGAKSRLKYEAKIKQKNFISKITSRPRKKK